MENLKAINIGDKVYCLYQLDDDEPSYEACYVIGVGAGGFWVGTVPNFDPRCAEYVSCDEVGEEIFFNETDAYRAVQDMIQDKVCDAYEAAKEEGFR